MTLLTYGEILRILTMLYLKCSFFTLGYS